MATVQFLRGYTWDNLPGAEVRKVIQMPILVSRLAGLRQEWQEVAESDGTTLVETKASVGLLLIDICNLLELTPDETQEILGAGFQGGQR